MAARYLSSRQNVSPRLHTRYMKQKYQANNNNTETRVQSFKNSNKVRLVYLKQIFQVKLSIV